MAGAGSATERWGALVAAEHAQADRVRSDAPGEDFWTPFAGQFRPDLAAPDDPTLQLITAMLSPDWTVLDVGAGGGRLSLPLARRCRHVTAVEPSPAMAGVLREAATSNGIGNVSVVEATWEDAQAAPSDLVVCAHVLYTARDIGPFLRKMEAHAREWVAVVLFTDPPQSQLFPFWPRVHGQERLRLPCLSELIEVLGEMGVGPAVHMLPPRPSQGFPDRDRARGALRARLFLTAGTQADRRLEEAMDELLVEGPDGALLVRGAPPLNAGLVTWRPAAARRD
jgi:SAM-dependent methyltransferase